MKEKNSPDNVSAAKRKPIVWRILKIAGFTLLGLLLLVTAAVSAFVWILTPDRLTPIVERTASENLNATVSADRVELSFWSTFPNLTVDVKNLNVVSKSLETLPDSVRNTLPVWADSLLTVGRFNGSINLVKLAGGTIAINHVNIEQAAANLLQVTDKVSNFDILPASNPDDDDSSGLPDFSFEKISLKGDLPVRYESRPDSVSLTLSINEVSGWGEMSPDYVLYIDGNALPEIGGINLEQLHFGLDGIINWEHQTPHRISIRGLSVWLGAINTLTEADLDFSDGLKIEEFRFRLSPVPVDSIMALVPLPVKEKIGPLGGTMQIGGNLTLTKPYNPSAFLSVPSFDMKLTLGNGDFRYDRLNLKKVALDLNAEVNGDNLNSSVINIEQMRVEGNAISFSLEANITNLISDPLIEGSFNGEIRTTSLPRQLLSRLPFEMKGLFKADCGFNLRKSFLTGENFHRIKFTGTAWLNDFALNMRDASAGLVITEAEMKLGTNSTIRIGDHKADSLLTASLDMDSVSFFTPGLEVTGKKWRVGIGTLNASGSRDTTVIRPIGAKIMAERLTMKNSHDSVAVRLRDATVSGALTRFHGDGHKPRLNLRMKAHRAIYADNSLKAFLSDAEAGFNLQPAAPRISRRVKARMDSIHEANPSLSFDSVYALAGSMRVRNFSDTVAAANAFDLDNSTVELFKKWNVKGTLNAARIAVFTPSFPIRSNLRNLDIAFSSDSVIVRDTRLTLGRSDFLINGKISNIARSVTSRRGSPLKMEFALTGDTVDVNRIAAAMFAGAAYQEKSGQVSDISVEADSEQQMQAMVDEIAATDTVAPIVIPLNIDAELRLNFKTVLYSDLLLNDLRGRLMIYGGAVNLRGLSARTDAGSMSLNALYSAPDRDDLKFAFGMSLKDFRIARFIRLMPSIDSIMPLLNDISGIINAEVAATSQLRPNMDIDIPTLSAAVKLTGDSLVLLDNETFRTVSKWLMFKNKNRNMIDSMSVEMVVENSQLELFPFVFDIDRYRLGVMGHNDLAMNFNYHVAVLKSPLPFRFGINISGNADKMKVRLGGARLNEKNTGKRVNIADTTRINLVRRIEQSFIRGIRNSEVGRLRFGSAPGRNLPESDEKISAADSAVFIREGLIEAPPPPPVDESKTVKSRRK